ncbi:MAG: hypothetical protein RH949_17275 [Coleofasciculus sp. A1-SPW-01]
MASIPDQKSDHLAEILVQGAVISAINWAETLSKLAERGQDPDTIVTQLIDLAGLSGVVQSKSVQFWVLGCDRV